MGVASSFLFLLLFLFLKNYTMQRHLGVPFLIHFLDCLTLILFSFFELRTESVTVSVMKQIRIHNILEKTRKKKEKADDSKNGVEGESPSVMKEQENLRKKVTDLIRKQKLPAVRKIVKGKDDSKPWNADARAKVCVLAIIDKI